MAYRFLLQKYPALGFPLYRRYWLASLASVGATQLITLGQGWLIFELSGSALQLGLLGAAAALPNILMTLAGGVIADRFDKRRIMMVTSCSISVLLLALAWLDYSGHVQVWHVLAVAALFSLVTGVDWPVRVSLYPNLVSRSAFLSAVALNSFVWQVTRMAMPALGGLIIAASDTWVLFLLSALGFLVMVAVISSIPPQPVRTGRGTAWEQVTEGVRFIHSAPLFRWLIVLTFVGMFFSQSYIQIMPAFASMLDGGETAYGYLLSAGGVGSVVGTLLVGGVQSRRQLGRMLLGGASLGAITTVAFAGLVTTGIFVLALGAVFLAAAFASVFMISSMSVMQLAVPDELRGRVMGIHAMGFSLMPLGGLFVGALAEVTGPSAAVILGSSIYLTCILWVAVSRPVIRRLNGRDIGKSAVAAQDAGTNTRDARAGG